TTAAGRSTQCTAQCPPSGQPLLAPAPAILASWSCKNPLWTCCSVAVVESAET
ncbi:hypothetical protein IWW55_007227, partial [Coemansia sp. RSA 2706]